MIGGVTSLTAAWLTQSHQATAERLSQEKSRRQKLYRDSIEETIGVHFQSRFMRDRDPGFWKVP
jgi:hypothetical protein